MTRLLVIPLLASTAIALAACGDAAPAATAAEPLVRDSAGITIVENQAPAWREGEGWRVSAEPVLEIGMIDGPEAYQLDGVRNAARLPDGSIVVADGGSRQVRIYDADGRHLRSMGGQGGGPGEFETLALVRPFRGDSIAAWDSRQKRLTVFDPDGAVGRVLTVEGVTGWMVPTLGWFDDGSLVVSPGMTPQALMQAESGPRREERTYLRVDPEGGIDTIATVPGRDEVVYHEGTSFGTRNVLFGRDAHAALRGDVLVAGESGHFAVTRYGPDGAPDHVTRVSTEPRTVTQAELAAARERAMESQRETGRRLAEQMGRPVEEPTVQFTHREAHPFFDALELDTTGHLWAREPLPGDAEDGEAPRTWQVFDPEGVWLGSVETPAGVRVTEIGEDYLLGIVRDDLDVEYVRMYRLVKPEA
jgi:hypothetical protein